MLRILHTADLLLDFPFAGNAELADLRRNDQLRTFEKLINLAIKNEVDLMVFAGNLFATPRPEPEIVEAVRGGLQRLADRKIVPLVLPGGLDGVPTPDNIYRLTSIPGLLISDYKRLRRPLSLEMKSTTVHLYGFAWGGGENDPAGLSTLKRVEQPGFHLGLLQGCADGDPSRYFSDLPLLDTAMLRSWGLDYVALGNCRNWLEIADDDKVLAAFPGSPEAVSFRETGPRYCALVTLSEEKPTLEKLSVNSRTLEQAEIDISGLASTEEIAGAISEQAHSETVLRAILEGEASVLPDVARLRALLAERFAGLEIEDRSVLLAGEFAEMLRRRGKPFSSLLEEAQGLSSRAADEKECRVLEDAFRIALERIEKAAEGQS